MQNLAEEQLLADIKGKTVSPYSPLISVLLYFDIFNYPLTAEEIYLLKKAPQMSRDVCNELLAQAVINGYIDCKKGFYFSGDESKVERRITGNAMAAEVMKTAKKKSGFISRFPYVKAVFLSGSLSKNYMDEKSDIDYFIIAEENRIWVCRMLLMLYKKLFLFNSRKEFCINYYVDTKTLEIPDKNIFTATEITHIIPVYGYQWYLRFLEANQWLTQYYPSLPPRKNEYIKDNEPDKKTGNLLPPFLGNMIDDACRSLMVTYWKMKHGNMPEKDMNINFRATKNVSKHHPNGYQQKVLAAHEERQIAFEKKWNIRLR